MQATSFSVFAATPTLRTGLIAAAVLAAVALAAAAMLLDPGQDASAAAPVAVLPTSAMVPVGNARDSAVSGDPSVPSAASVFKDGSGSAEEPPVSF